MHVQVNERVGCHATSLRTGSDGPVGRARLIELGGRGRFIFELKVKVGLVSPCPMCILAMAPDRQIAGEISNAVEPAIVAGCRHQSSSSSCAAWSGSRPLSLAGVTAVVIRDNEVLLGHRSDNHALTPVTGIVDPGEEPADAAVREAFEEAGVVIRADRLAWVHQVPRVTYDNGDQSDYLDLTFRCSWVSGEPHPADGEMTDVGWYDLDALPATIDSDTRRRIAAALPEEDPARFEGGR